MRPGEGNPPPPPVPCWNTAGGRIHSHPAQGKLPPTFLTLACSALESFSAFLASFSSCFAVNYGENKWLVPGYGSAESGTGVSRAPSCLPTPPATPATAAPTLWLRDAGPGRRNSPRAGGSQSTPGSPFSSLLRREAPGTAPERWPRRTNSAKELPLPAAAGIGEAPAAGKGRAAASPAPPGRRISAGQGLLPRQGVSQRAERSPGSSRRGGRRRRPSGTGDT